MPDWEYMGALEGAGRWWMRHMETAGCPFGDYQLLRFHRGHTKVPPALHACILNCQRSASVVKFVPRNFARIVFPCLAISAAIL